MMEEKQINLFDLSQYGGKKLRGPYKEKEKKEEKLDPYIIISMLYSEISNYLPIPIFSTGQEQYDYGYLTLWYSHYTSENYNYQGENYPGEDFKVIQAELKGTEDLFINERIFLHKKLLELIKKGMNIQEAAKLLQPLISKFQTGDIILELDYGENNTLVKN